MNRPSSLTCFLGHWVVTLGVLAIGGLLLFQWWQGQVDSDILPAVAAVVMISAANANQKLTEYKNWKRAWDALGGVSTRRKQHRLSRQMLGFLLWLVTALALTTLDRSQPKTVVAISCYGLATLPLVVWLVFQYRRQRGPDRKGPGKEFIVSVSLGVPWRSPGTRQFTRGLPAYCSRLF